MESRGGSWGGGGGGGVKKAQKQVNMGECFLCCYGSIGEGTILLNLSLSQPSPPPPCHRLLITFQETTVV